MSAELKPMIAVLFDHELRAAAAALHRLADARPEAEKTTDEAVGALRLAYAALFTIRPHIDAITVIDIKDKRLAGTIFPPSAKAPDKKADSQ